MSKIVGRILKLLTRRGALVEEQDSLYVADDDGDSDDARALRPLQSAACTYRIAFGSRAGYKLLTVLCAMPRELGLEQELCAEMHGFSLVLHAAARCEPDDRQGLERLCCYITRPTLAFDRAQCNAAGRGAAEAEDAVTQRHDASGDVAVGVHAAAGCTGSMPAPDCGGSS